MKAVHAFYLAIFLVVYSYQTTQAQYKRSEFEKLMDIRNRISIIHDDSSKELAYLTEKQSKPKSEKIYTWYRAQRITSTQGGYAGKLLDGDYRRYFPNKQLAKQGRYMKGLQHRKWTFWNENGKLSKEEHWKRGKLSGSVTQFDNEGSIQMDGHMKDGKWHGKVKKFAASDSLASWLYYNQGTLISKEEYINKSLFRKTGRSLRTIWNRIFSKRSKDSESQTIDTQ
ncbi:toxin-antitoxin system YwqK family antitoxin [Sphingobacterium hotanense]|uniref:toxin-antitoxin system YwqK family antitoxin n=1 Tax=Sphingobacterium hotanense TaxID=649196 RepID=UPI0021A8911D|nr:hypothetical protein [Sphingobacterium hotanense]MCT1526451.1 hypothetical protein [Sphingobacterium hotanense]